MVEIKINPLVRADPKMASKVETENYRGVRQKKDMKTKGSHGIFSNKMFTLYPQFT